MKLYTKSYSFRTQKNFVSHESAEDVIYNALNNGSESKQLGLLQRLVSILTEKMLDNGTLVLSDVQVLLNELHEKYHDSPNKVDLEDD